jgi:hypothetical protein
MIFDGIGYLFLEFQNGGPKLRDKVFLYYFILLSQTISNLLEFPQNDRMYA